MLSMKEYNRFGFNEVDPSENFLDPWWCGDFNYFDVLVDIIESHDKKDCEHLLKELQETGLCTMYSEMEALVIFEMQKGKDPSNVDEYTGYTEFRLEISLEKSLNNNGTFTYVLTMTLICDLVAETEWDKETIDTLEQVVKTHKSYSEKEMTAHIVRWFENVAKCSE